jgi:hypothetical protein
MKTYRYENRNCYGEFCFSSNYPENETSEENKIKGGEDFIQSMKDIKRAIKGGDQMYMICNETNEETKIF